VDIGEKRQPHLPVANARDRAVFRRQVDFVARQPN